MDSPSATKTRPRVVQCITRLGLGGAEAVALTLVRALRDEFEFAVFAVHGVEDSEMGRSMARELVRLRVPLFCGSSLPLKWGGLLPAGQRAARMSRDFKPAIAHLHTEIPECAHAARLVLHPGGRPPAVVRTIHNTVYWHYWPRTGRWCERRLRHSHVACVSQAAQDAYATFRGGSGAGPLPIPPVVIYNGVAMPAAAASRPHATHGPRRILFAGRFEHQKGTDLLPLILAGVRLPSPGAELVLYGQGTHLPLLERLAAQPPAGWKVHVLRPTAELRERMPEFNLVIMPSRFEGLPLVAVEAALLGVPLVATDAAGLRETLPPDHPWCAPAGDPDGFAQTLRQALATPQCWPEVAARARTFARQRFDPGTMAAGYRELYARALSCPPAPGAAACQHHECSAAPPPACARRHCGRGVARLAAGERKLCAARRRFCPLCHGYCHRLAACPDRGDSARVRAVRLPGRQPGLCPVDAGALAAASARGIRPAGGGSLVAGAVRVRTPAALPQRGAELDHPRVAGGGHGSADVRHPALRTDGGARLRDDLLCGVLFSRPASRHRCPGAPVPVRGPRRRQPCPARGRVAGRPVSRILSNHPGGSRKPADLLQRRSRADVHRGKRPPAGLPGPPTAALVGVAAGDGGAAVRDGRRQSGLGARCRGGAVLARLVARPAFCPLAQVVVIALAFLSVAGLALLTENDWARGKYHGITERVVSLGDFFGGGTYVSEESFMKGDNNRFRVVWWRSVIDETLAENPVFGLGFGHDLARNFLQEYNPDMAEDFTARSPHSIAISAFGRMGLVGFGLFLLLCGILAVRTFRAMRHPSTTSISLGLWTSLWAILISACFGVVLEGPMGAVVFWTLLGLASATTAAPAEPAALAEAPDPALPEAAPTREFAPVP